MAKILVIKTSGEPVPFLRGILVQSLISAGLSFDNAYAATQAVRDTLGDREQISGGELAALVAQLLGERFGPEIRQAYEAQAEDDQETVVRTLAGVSRFSVGLLTRSLEAYAIDPDCSREAARMVHENLRQQGRREVDHMDLRRAIYACLAEHCSNEAAERYLSWYQFELSADPLIILVGGATGTGKSTVTSALAYRLDIVRTQSTDMMREIIRAYLAPHVVPTLGYSSFEAWRGLPSVEVPKGKRRSGDPVIAGFLSQVGNVRAALEATIARGVKERHHLIVDGIHVLPSELDLREAGEKAVVVPIMLAVTTRERLAFQLARRSREQPGRGKSSRYLKNMDAIWELQSYLLAIADKRGIPIIGNWTIETSVQQVLDEVSRRVGQRYPPDPSVLSL